MKKILAALFGLATLVPTAAMAEETSATLSAECEWKASISCEATCNPTASYFQCDVDPPDCSAKIPTECKAEIEASASCNVESCSASCEAECNAKPPAFSCTSECQAKLEADCTAKIDANCQSRCASDANKASCESSCKSELQATCKGTGSASCDAKCEGTKGTADCKGTCQASCQGGCDAQAQARATCDGYLKCKSPLKVQCQTDFQTNCKGKCEASGGALVCNGQVVSYGDLNAVKAWFEQHGYANGSSSASCSGNTCQAQAEGEAGVSCSASSVPVGSGAPAALGFLAVGYAASRLRRKRGLPDAGLVGYTPTMLAVRRRLLAFAPGGLLLLSLLLLLPRLAQAATPGGDSFTQALEKGPLYAGLAALFGGFLVSLTPCVYPMIAITVSVFGAHEARSRWQAAALSSVFVLGIAAMFTPLGVAAGLTGSAFGTALASKWVVIGIATLFLALSASLFGAFEFVLPDSLMQRLSAVGGVGYGGAFLLGLVSGIVAAPCTGPVLTGILLWIGKTQSASLGAAALFAFSLGLGVPFWLVGTFAVNLPKSGRWMVYIKSIFGVVMMIAALYYLRNPFPVLVSPVKTTPTFALLSAGAIVVGLLLGAVHLGFDDPRPTARIRKGLGILAAVAGGFFLIGWVQAPRGEFHWVHSEEEGRQAALAQKKPVLIDFTATWCGACQELAKHTFTDPRVRAEADRFVTIKVDATNDEDPLVEAIMKRYRVAGLPTVVLLDAQGKEKHRFVDFVKADDFYEVIRKVE